MAETKNLWPGRCMTMCGSSRCPVSAAGNTSSSLWTVPTSWLSGCCIQSDMDMSEKAAVYQQLAELNRQIRQERKNLALCREIMDWIPQMEKTIQSADELKKEVERDEHRRR